MSNYGIHARIRVKNMLKSVFIVILFMQKNKTEFFEKEPFICVYCVLKKTCI